MGDAVSEAISCQVAVETRAIDTPRGSIRVPAQARSSCTRKRGQRSCRTRRDSSRICHRVLMTVDAAQITVGQASCAHFVLSSHPPCYIRRKPLVLNVPHIGPSRTRQYNGQGSPLKLRKGNLKPGLKRLFVSSPLLALRTPGDPLNVCTPDGGK